MHREAPLSFEQVLPAELDTLARQRVGAVPDKTAGMPIYQRARAMNLAALAFSGGGIRSAAFSLGFLQRLANHKTLHLFDYLSTVSGGGHIGAWLAALLRRSGKDAPGEAEVRERQQQLATPPDAAAGNGSSGFPGAPAPSFDDAALPAGRQRATPRVRMPGSRAGRIGPGFFPISREVGNT